MEFDWATCESELTASAVAAVRTLVAAAAGQRPYAVAFSEFYAETTGVIYLPNLALATEESVPEPSYRFSPPDWEFQDYEWGDTDASWGDRLSEAVTGLPRAQWDEAWERFAQAMLTIAAGVRAALVADGILPTDGLSRRRGRRAAGAVVDHRRAAAAFPRVRRHHRGRARGDPTVAALVAEELAPGHGYCTLDATDLPGARIGLDHAEPVIRRHAVIVIGELIGPLAPRTSTPTTSRPCVPRSPRRPPRTPTTRSGGWPATADACRCRTGTVGLSCWSATPPA
ncbi:DUF4303 domain-containing protein [Mycobacterium sp. CBMA293]|uniref:DUF4303 domain-containing protein n=1 Tax=unclassified Mycolicibacterium TaxID=2636767 RepID=UPI0012DEBD98|nr:MULTISPECIES: DUF4303 domain-containing protein [unclassified Mycolicibacterium]MUL44902.1 DUF4303 domain-containing protein [Mycolicibacterium sp. CBMA 360]MUL57989.1 DUF4303 domain-containing protein [Mycolicibacterium sp. CBMA 335]MUL73447.1 DUF4303 domain-containing protein [Mycolicibacterium sp. CBMA 311]MUL95495.1 DUF4303 domain-containing protein [Mycolicibacterium sp. CBMA 230]MUM07420.1 hypothetical protein [Mycolicibacterium sp. CBMA 213]